MNIVIAVQNVFVLKQILEQRKRGLDAIDDELVECAAQAANALVTVATVNDELADHAVVVRRDLVALIGTRIHTNAETAGVWK